MAGTQQIKLSDYIIQLHIYNLHVYNDTYTIQQSLYVVIFIYIIEKKNNKELAGNNFLRLNKK
mgnify:CR=1 FL=1